MGSLIILGKMTCFQYARLYAACADCAYCGAHRGEFCHSNRGKIMTRSWHVVRGNLMRDFRRRHKERYWKLWNEVQRVD